MLLPGPTVSERSLCTVMVLVVVTAGQTGLDWMRGQVERRTGRQCWAPPHTTTSLSLSIHQHHHTNYLSWLMSQPVFSQLYSSISRQERISPQKTRQSEISSFCPKKAKGGPIKKDHSLHLKNNFLKLYFNLCLANFKKNNSSRDEIKQCSMSYNYTMYIAYFRAISSSTSVYLEILSIIQFCSDSYVRGGHYCCMQV